MAKRESKAKEKYKTRILKHLSNPDNVFVTRITEIAKALEMSQDTLAYHFRAADMVEVCQEALKLRRENYTGHSETVDKALIKKAKAGDVAAQRLFYQVIEGFGEKTFHESRHVVVAEPIKKGDEKGEPKSK
jgi:hypothetical protein